MTAFRTRILVVMMTLLSTICRASARSQPSSLAFQMPNLFGGKSKTKVAITSNQLEKRKEEILRTISFTNNGKDASPQKQAQVLKLVREIEQDYPPSVKLLTDANEAEILDGTWYLQYTSPSKIDVEIDDDAEWTGAYADKENVETKPFTARGSVSAAGIRVETANRIVTQSIDVDKMRVANNILLDWGQIFVAGSFRPSTMVPTRAVVAFDTANITLEKLGKITIKLGFLFSLLALTRGGNTDNGWLETTFVDKDVRIGRGNKGTLFILTRDQVAVLP